MNTLKYIICLAVLAMTASCADEWRDDALEQAKSAEELRISEFNSLQSQINPHFLYNTMDMINWKAQQGQKAETTAAIRDLSRFYKLTKS